VNTQIANFDDLLRAARAQPEPQRLLFVFATAELPEDSTPQQHADFLVGQGGALTPMMSVDKAPEALNTFAALVAESREFGHDWAIVFVAGLSGRAGCPPSSAEAEQSLQRMIEAIKSGAFGSYMAFDRDGEPVLFG
jgi:hypothetical protein